MDRNSGQERRLRDALLRDHVHKKPKQGWHTGAVMGALIATMEWLKDERDERGQDDQA